MASISRRELLVGGASLALTTACRAPAALASGRGAALSFEEYVAQDAVGLAALVARKEVTPAELLEVAIARTEAVDPKLNAVVIRHFDAARAVANMDLPAGPLSGVPWLLKDLHLYVRGTVTSNGSVAWKDRVADYDSTLVERYRAAGLVIFGKTASPEFGATAVTESTLWGATRNPWNLAHTPGGSSGGSAAAVAAGIVPAANASDGGGSIRIPASCCGLFGLKPTRGRVPRGPHSYSAHSFSCIHAVTRSVRDSAVLLDASRGSAPYDYTAAPPVARPFAEEVGRDPGPLRVGWVKTPVTRLPVHVDCEAAAAQVAKQCASWGHTVEEVALPVEPRKYYTAVGINNAVHTARRIRARGEERGRPVGPDEIEPGNWSKLAQADGLSADDLASAEATFRKTAADMATLMQRYDVLLSPTMAAPPVKIGVMSLSNPDQEEFITAATAASAFTMLYNVSGQPAMSLPLHWNAAGLPIGVMFAAAFGREDLLFRLASQIEGELPWFGKRPPLAG
ncbi:MAG: amidase [Myxococcota bacterium]